MKPGFRQNKQPSAKDQLASLTKMVENLSQAVRVQQLIFQQFANNFGKLDKDMHNAMGVINDLQYRTLALIETSTVSKDELDSVAERLKLKDYNEASDKEDQEKGYTVSDTVKEDSIVIITTECEDDPMSSLFRSKFKLSESGNDDLKQKALGLKVGDKVDIVINGRQHKLELLGVREEPPKEEADNQTETPQEAPVH
jgi:hypothetical protein